FRAHRTPCGPPHPDSQGGARGGSRPGGGRRSCLARAEPGGLAFLRVFESWWLRISFREIQKWLCWLDDWNMFHSNSGSKGETGIMNRPSRKAPKVERREFLKGIAAAPALASLGSGAWTRTARADRSIRGSNEVIQGGGE